MIKKHVSPAPETNALFTRVCDILESARTNIARTVNTSQVLANWLIGREIVEAEQAGEHRAAYGRQLLKSLSKRLTEAYGRGFSVSSLQYMRSFFLAYPKLLLQEEYTPIDTLDSIQHAVRVKSKHDAVGMLNPSLSWTHYRTLLKVERPQARDFYEIESVKNSWSARELERQINSLMFDRLANSRNKDELLKLASEGFHPLQSIDVLKDPMVLEFLDLPESPKLVESTLEQALISNLQTFLLELGKGFAFVSRQERISLDGDHFYIDLVFYHTILKCFVLIDLKVGKLSHGDLGQIQFYVNYYDKERRSEGDNPTIGVVLCPDKNDAVVKYTLGEQQEKNIFTSRYQLYLPTEEELQQEIQRELRYLDSKNGDKSGGQL